LTVPLKTNLFVQDDTEKGIVHLNLAVVLDEAQFPEFVHEEIDSGPRCANHLRQHLLRHLGKRFVSMARGAIAPSHTTGVVDLLAVVAPRACRSAGGFALRVVRVGDCLSPVNHICGNGPQSSVSTLKSDWIALCLPHLDHVKLRGRDPINFWFSILELIPWRGSPRTEAKLADFASVEVIVDAHVDSMNYGTAAKGVFAPLVESV
jgi:hypothetical protein